MIPTKRRFVCEDGSLIAWDEKRLHIQPPAAGDEPYDQGVMLMNVITTLIHEIEQQDAKIVAQEKQRALDREDDARHYRAFSQQIGKRSADGMTFKGEKKIAVVRDASGRFTGFIEQTFVPATPGGNQ